MRSITDSAKRIPELARVAGRGQSRDGRHFDCDILGIWAL